MEADLRSCAAISFPRKGEITKRMKALEEEMQASLRKSNLTFGNHITMLITVDVSDTGPKLNISIPQLNEVRENLRHAENDIRLLVNLIDELQALTKQVQDEINQSS